MKPWHAKWLTPFEALQLLVSLQHDDDCAEALADYSAVSWIALRYRSARDETCEVRLRPAGPAFRTAEVELVAWCRQGLIRGNAVLDTQRVKLDDYWSNGRDLIFENSTLTGKPVLRGVCLLSADILRLASRKNALLEQPTAGKQHTAAAKTEAVHRAIATLWPKGIPEHLPAKERDAKIVEWSRATGGATKISDRQIQRALKGGPTRADK